MQAELAFAQGMRKRVRLDQKELSVAEIAEQVRDANVCEFGAVGQQGDAGVILKAAVDILPEEIWIKILKMVENPKDRWNLCFICRLFRDTLHEWRTGYTLEQVLPYLTPGLSKDSILNLRQVRKGWTLAVDSFIENHPSLRPHSEEHILDFHRKDFVCPIKDMKLYKNNAFIFSNDEQDNFKVVEGPGFPGRNGHNPFMGRYVCISLGREAFDEDGVDRHNSPWWDRLDRFLELFGKHIWNLLLTFPHKPNRSVWERLAQFIEHSMFRSMPNLRKLTVDSDGWNFPIGFLRGIIPDAPCLETIEILRVNGEMDDDLTRVLVTRFGLQQLQKIHLNGQE